MEDFVSPENITLTRQELYEKAWTTPMHMMWLKRPEGFDPNSLPESTPPLTFRDAPDDLLIDVMRCHNEAFRKAKQSGQTLPPEFDPDLVWNGTAYVPKKRVTG
jgi:hypothetical protein